MPSRNDCATCSYSRLDYDSDAEFNHDFIRSFTFLFQFDRVVSELRDRCMRIVRDCLEAKSDLLYDLCRNWVTLRATVDPRSRMRQPSSFFIHKWICV